MVSKKSHNDGWSKEKWGKNNGHEASRQWQEKKKEIKKERRERRERKKEIEKEKDYGQVGEFTRAIKAGKELEEWNLGQN